MSESNSFLGKGWSFPPTFETGGAYLQMAEGVEDIRQSLSILVTTQAGERIMQEGFGCAMDNYVFEGLSRRLMTGISGSIRNAILYYESRIKLEKVEVSEVPDNPGELRISIDYIIKSLNARENLVFPFYLNEGRLTEWH